MDDQARAIGRRVRYWRLRRNLGRQRFADMVGRSVSWLDKVERGERSQVKNFELQSFFRKKFGRLKRQMDHCGISNHADVVALASEAGFAKRNHIVVSRNFFLNAPI